MLVKLNNANRETAIEILRIQIPAYKAEAAIIGFDGIPQLTDTVETIMDCPETFIGYNLKEELAGCISFTETEQEIDICRLVVHPDHYRKGIARQLVNYIVTELSKDRSIIVSTGALNTPAKNLYKNFGFIEVRDAEVGPGIFITLLEKKQI
ncbi:GNAT family N-acetyltransferase [Peribacillus saganii]|uniref:GNAT family N-acetyltransferase n=1 Tax=Peribacillus saganii TaxID=2303992 RepID=A0A372LE60_9BACI|nr:GNAT family N-acetyltransferase [Peribacillus saganii]RFU64476.1 GNAT family N-acetyltransferase [Peribacillus saganii]